MISNDKIKDIIDKMSENRHSIRVTDISFVLLCRSYEDEAVAYKSLFGNSSETEISIYAKSASIVALKKFLAEEFGWDSKKDISFEENKSEIIRLIQEAKDKEASGELDAKQSLELQTKLRVALNDKFGAKEEMKDQIVQVSVKYNSICDCGRELYIPTKEDLMKQYNLVEKDK